MQPSDSNEPATVGERHQDDNVELSAKKREGLLVQEAVAHDAQEEDNQLVISYLRMRMILGALGIGLPVSLALSSLVTLTKWQTSLSAYYGTDMRNFFVGFLTAIGVFLLSYRGYQSENVRLTDNLVTNFAGVAALGVAFFPIVGHEKTWLIVMHYGSAVVLFVALAVMSLFLFTKHDSRRDQPPPDKRQRNLIYRICGLVMVASIVAMGANFLISAGWIGEPPTWLAWAGYDYLILVAESLAIVAFGISWLVKGKALEQLNRKGIERLIGGTTRRLFKWIRAKLGRQGRQSPTPGGV